MSKKYDVVILGAGISGLSAAYYLQKLGKTVLVLEAKDRIGGRLVAANLKCKTGSDYWDLGGERVQSTQPHVMELINELGLLTYKVYSQQTGEKSFESEEDGVLEFKVKGSAWKICDKLADKILRENIICGDPVIKIVQAQDGLVGISTKAGKSYTANHVISAIPPHLVNEIEFDPPLPLDQKKVRQKIPFGNLIKFVITYQTAFWREKELPDKTSLTGPPFSVDIICDVIDGSIPENPALIGYICADQVNHCSKKSMEERKTTVLESLSKIFGKKCLDVIDYQDKDWSTEPHNGGCRGYAAGPSWLLDNYTILTKPHGRIHWAGSELARLLYAYMDGAVEASKKAVDEINQDN